MAVRFSLARLCALLLVPAGARAATTFGADLTQIPDTTPGCCDVWLNSPTAPSDGVLVRWTLRTTTAATVAPAVFRSGLLQSSDAATTTTSPLTVVAVRLDASGHRRHRA